MVSRMTIPRLAALLVVVSGGGSSTASDAAKKAATPSSTADCEHLYTDWIRTKSGPKDADTWIAFVGNHNHPSCETFGELELENQEAKGLKSAKQKVTRQFELQEAHLKEAEKKEVAKLKNDVNLDEAAETRLNGKLKQEREAYEALQKKSEAQQKKSEAQQKKSEAKLKKLQEEVASLNLKLKKKAEELELKHEEAVKEKKKCSDEQQSLLDEQKKFSDEKKTFSDEKKKLNHANTQVGTDSSLAYKFYKENICLQTLLRSNGIADNQCYVESVSHLCSCKA